MTTTNEATAGSAPASRPAYDRPTRMLHWATVLLVSTLYGLAQTWGFLPRGTPARHLMQVTHVSLGLILTAVILARIVWRLSPASTPQDHAGLEGLAARAVHLLLYLLIAGEIALGWSFRWAQGEPLSLFGLFAIPAPWTFPASARHTLAGLHDWTANGIMIVAGLHALAALAHHYVLRDDVLRRMVGQGTPGPARKTSGLHRRTV